jgi:hypothetical protein
MAHYCSRYQSSHGRHVHNMNDEVTRGLQFQDSQSNRVSVNVIVLFTYNCIRQ